MKDNSTSCNNVEGEASVENRDVYSTGNGSQNTSKSLALLLRAEQVAEFLNISVAHVYRMRNAGKLPKPVKLGGVVRWRLDELKQWVAAGMPNMLRWNQMRGGAA
ncbi:Prophage CP4-57 regulatory protein (AlpA) [Poriferisphaera corsica]|uniref:Prophage CP4-57 regulatory protein (AlpA) n=1 Tax=Poriferisphaera corsica TaxID=2528020 RepID=A0A517YXE5_9BACT|nr:helix-turn-helix domain-containing protein [Poriferisphaera corsica]QDU34898.1 Prophage CP4-57 regulatory protein (AlpA) [Poriferisphaera corsica]